MNIHPKIENEVLTEDKRKKKISQNKQALPFQIFRVIVDCQSFVSKMIVAHFVPHRHFFFMQLLQALSLSKLFRVISSLISLLHDFFMLSAMKESRNASTISSSLIRGVWIFFIWISNSSCSQVSLQSIVNPKLLPEKARAKISA